MPEQNPPIVGTVVPDAQPRDVAAEALEAQLGEVRERMGLSAKGAGIKAPQPERMLRFFKYEHLPPSLQEMSKPFCELARWLCEKQQPSPERTKALNELCAAKDWAVRALVPE